METDEVDNKLRESLQVKPPSEVVEFINLLVYGEAGVGKTYLCGTADDDPRLRPLLLFDIEGGVTTIRHRSNVDVVSVRSMKELEEKFNKLYHSIRSDGTMYYKTVGLDSGNELADLDMRTVMKQAYEKNPNNVNIDVPSPREWGIVRNHIRLIIRAFKDLLCHFVMTAGLGVDQPQDQPPKYYPGFAGKLAREIPGFNDIVGYLNAKNNQGTIDRYLQVVGTNRVVAKDRTSSLGQMVENPTLTKLWDIIEGVPLPTQESDGDSIAETDTTPEGNVDQSEVAVA